jgi:uncharacterized protein (UPF0262 family)
MNTTEYIEKLTLDDNSIIRRTPEVEHERAQAIADLLEENSFAPNEVNQGPYHLHIAIVDNRLTFEIHSFLMNSPVLILLPLTPFRGIIKDYFMICESYFDAIRDASPAKIETIDMARRGIHNDGSNLLIDLLEGKISFDFDTARRLFTLICVLHIK